MCRVRCGRPARKKDGKNIGIRIIVLSRHISNIASNDPKQPYVFTYRIRVENHNHEWVQLLGRHWVITDSNGKETMVDKFQPGVVGHQPLLEMGNIFVYGSGVFLGTPTGVMKGSFQFNSPSGELFDGLVVEFNLIAEQSDRDENVPSS